MKEEFVTYEVAKLAKEAGFDEKCWIAYNPEGDLVDKWDDWNDPMLREAYPEGVGSYCQSRNSELEKNGGGYITAPTIGAMQDWLISKKGRIPMVLKDTELFYPYDHSSPVTLGFASAMILNEKNSFDSYFDAINKAFILVFENLSN